MKTRLLAGALAAALCTPAHAQTAAPLPQVAKSGGVVPGTAANSAVRPLRFGQVLPQSGVIALPLGAVTALPASVREQVERAVRAAAFTGRADSVLSLRGIGTFDRILVIGTGVAAPTQASLADLGGRIAQEVRNDDAPVAILTDGLRLPSGPAAAAVAMGFDLGQYRFDRYKTDGRKAPPVQPVTIVTRESGAESAYARDSAAVVAGVTFSRDLATEPANIIYPESFVERTRAAFAGLPNVRIEVLDETDMRRLGMGAFLGVGQGSVRPPRLLIVEYRGAGAAAPLAFVGKGITFDSGGISIKPALAMWEMKADMSGAATTVGTVLALARRGAMVNALGVAALAENMPGGNAQRPGDVVRTMDGRTVEVLNTDAEGRLVLADANQYVIDRYKPAAVINVATLTGAIVRALDDEYAGMFARNEDVARRLQAAADASGEAIWRMPLHPNYAEDMRSDIADIKNVNEGGGPGAGLAAHFISYLTPQPTPWGHLDIAGVNWMGRSLPTVPKGASGWGVRLLDQFARGYEVR